MSKYLGNWADTGGRDAVIADFFPGWQNAGPPEDFPTDEEILYASYETPSYEGDALVIYERAGKVYEVNGSHCSCYGLEGQWTPEETSWEALAMRKLYYHDQPTFMALVGPRLGAAK